MSAKREKNAAEEKPVAAESESSENNPADISGKKSFFQNEQLIIAVIVLATALVYFNSLNNRFVYDDWFQIERNPLILSWENAPKLLTESVWQFMETDKSVPVGPYYRPVFSFTLLLNYQLFGFNVAGWHLFSVLFHLGTTLLVYVLVQQWSKSREIAAVAAFIFGIHPVHTEAVAWASASNEVLVGFFAIASIVLYEKARKAGAGKWIFIAFSAIAALLAMGSKEIGIMIPVFFAAREAIAYFQDKDNFDFKESVSKILPFIVCAAIYLGLRYSVLGFISKPHPLAKDVTTLEWILTVPYLFFEYMRLNIFPYPLAFVYDYRFISSFADPRLWIGLTALACIGFFIYKFGRNSAIILFSAALFIIFILPVLNLKAFSPFESIFHDRYLYLPSAGFCIIAAVLLFNLAEKISKKKETALIGFTLVTGLIFGGLTVMQNRYWQNDFALTENALRFAPEWAFLHTHYGEINAERGDFQKAEEHLKKAVEIGENLAGTYKSLGYVYAKQGRFAEAETALKKAIELGQPTVYSWVNLGIAQFQLGKFDDAEFAFNNALNELKENQIALYYLGMIYEKRGNTNQAEQFYKNALEIQPKFEEARIALANLFSSQNRIREALQQIEIIRKENPSNTEVMLSAAGIFLRDKQCEEAIEILNRLVALQPKNNRAFISLGIAFECVGKIEEAKKAYQKAIEIAPEVPANNVARRRLENLNKGIIEKIQ